MPARKDINKILIIGSGPIVVGQACEFDYSGTQAVQTLLEEGFDVVVVNPNPASFMTTSDLGATVYIEPLRVDYLREIIRKERPQALLATLGGQTALNLAVALEEQGILSQFHVELIGAKLPSIHVAENRGLFREKMQEHKIEIPHSELVNSFAQALEVVKQFSFPLILRPSFTLGGQGGRVVFDYQEFTRIVEQSLFEAPDNSVLIEESLLGWKEFELEVMRDRADNAMVVCSIENVDPMGIHTGDSITVAPVQTLSDREYQRMRSVAIEVLRAVGVDCGGSNVQFAFDEASGRMLVIEMNPRVSRSSALASKATGFPIARCATRLAIGYTLDEIRNEITGKTTACFEPTLDYCAVKVPRFEFDKFRKAGTRLGSEMKSIGESLGLGRSFIAALNKALRSSECGYDGICALPEVQVDELYRMITSNHPQRIFAIYTLLQRGHALWELASLSGISEWFLFALSEQIALEAILPSDPAAHLLKAKQYAMSDARIAACISEEEAELRERRRRMELHTVYHYVDTCAGEFQALTPYFYSDFGEINESEPIGDNAVMILGSGPNRIGQGLEFDTCCTLATRAYRKLGVRTVMVNNNPETVSTDFNVVDRLYLEPITVESITEILAHEGIKDVIVQLGGQTPLNIATELEARGARIVGTPLQAIHRSEDRGLFRELLHTIGLRQPRNLVVHEREHLFDSVSRLGYPVLLRPSFVLGGRSMLIAYTPDDVEEFLRYGIVISAQSPLLVEEFLVDALEYDVDVISDGHSVYVAGIMQHIERAGIHSGDSACSFPPYSASQKVQELMLDATKRIVLNLGICGFCNIQYASKGDTLYVIEVNPRASRTVPFLAKARGIDLIEICVKVWQGQSLKDQGISAKEGELICAPAPPLWAVKEAMFSFSRFAGFDPLLGPEMRSTGESMGRALTFGEAFAKASLATGNNFPTSGKIFLSLSEASRKPLLPIAKELVNRGFQLAANRATAAFLFAHDILCEVMLDSHEAGPNVIDHIRGGHIDFLINIPTIAEEKREAEIRSEAIQRKIPYTTTVDASQAAVEGIKALQDNPPSVSPLGM